MQTRTVLGVDTCTYLPVERRNAPPLRLHRLQATGTAGLAHQSRRRALGFGKSPRNLMSGSETVWANGLSQRWRHEDAAHHSALTLRKVRAVFELRHEEGAGRSTLTLRNVREVAGRPRITTPSQNARRGGVGTPIEKANARFW